MDPKLFFGQRNTRASDVIQNEIDGGRSDDDDEYVIELGKYFQYPYLLL